jgi:YNFM family putative membrane transporter
VSAALPVADRALARMIVLMAIAAFASGASLRVSDPLLPQVAADFHASLGSASAIVTAYAVPYGLTQALAGLIGDRMGKCQAVAAACAVSCVLVLACSASQSLPQLALARLLAAPGAAIIVPLGMAYVGDTVPYARRQTVLARFLAGQMCGMIAGQAAGGVIGDLLGWRTVFLVLAAVFAAAALALARELGGNPYARPQRSANGTRPGLIASYRKLVAVPWCRFILLAVFLEGGIFFGGFAYVAADLTGRFGVSFATAGLVVAMYGVGSVFYAGSVQRLLAALGERGLAVGGGIVVAIGFVALAGAPSWLSAPIACGMLGYGYYMLHNTLQTNATQMQPEARGTAVAAFSSALFLGQSAGVALMALLVDRSGAVPAFALAAAAWLALALWVSMKLKPR